MSGSGVSMELARRFDHAVLSPTATSSEIEDAARRCAESGVRGLCVAPRHAAVASRHLAGSAVKLVVTAGFPAAASRASVTRAEAKLAVRDGAAELDVVLPLGDLIEGRFERVLEEITRLAAAVKGTPLKLIVEASLVDDATLGRLIRQVVVPSGALYLKTGTGVYGGPLSPDRIRRLRDLLPGGIGLKVAGGIRDLGSARAAIDAGADLLGCSRTFEILAAAAGRDPRTGPENPVP